MLVSKEPPAPADGSQDTGHNRGQEGGLSLNWAVPNVLAKDVPNFEQLSPELEAGTAPSCACSPSTCPAHRSLGAETLPCRCSRAGRGQDSLIEHLLCAKCGASAFIQWCHSLHTTAVGLHVFLTPFH